MKIKAFRYLKTFFQYLYYYYLNVVILCWFFILNFGTFDTKWKILWRDVNQSHYYNNYYQYSNEISSSHLSTDSNGTVSKRIFPSLQIVLQVKSLQIYYLYEASTHFQDSQIEKWANNQSEKNEPTTKAWIQTSQEEIIL